MEITMKLIALYKQPDDVEAFEDAYSNHLTLVDKIPGLQETRVTRFRKTLAGDGFYLMAEMIFPDKESFNAAMTSPEMAATGEDVNRFATGLMTLMIGTED